MIKVALLSRWHVHANEYASYALNNPNVKVVKVWDEDSIRGNKWASELNVEYVSDINDIYNDNDVDAVIVTSPTSMHKELIIGAAKAKKHIFTEKVLAFTVNDCLEIYDAVEANDVKLMVSLPRLTENYFLYVESEVKAGLVGKVNTIRCKLAHDGGIPNRNSTKGWLPQAFFDLSLCGGGAFIDLGAHPIYLTNRIGGKVKHLSANFSKFNNEQVDDHSTVIVEYSSGATGILEASFVTRGCPFILEVSGTEGTIIVEDGKVRVRSIHLNNGNWIEPILPERKAMPFIQWINAILYNHPSDISKEDVIRLTEVNEMALNSHQNNIRVFR